MLRKKSWMEPKFFEAEIDLEVVSKPQIRFKGKAQADRESAAYIWVCEHLSEVCNAAIGPQMGF
jgi:hypothetical protein